MRENPTVPMHGLFKREFNGPYTGIFNDLAPVQTGIDDEDYMTLRHDEDNYRRPPPSTGFGPALPSEGQRRSTSPDQFIVIPNRGEAIWAL